jgi:hypothetical protein
MPALDPGELQSLLTTMQQTNQQLGQIAKAIAQSIPLNSLAPATTAANLGIYANDAAASAAGVPLHGLYLNSSTFALIARHV